jgi:hypothetical protein
MKRVMHRLEKKIDTTKLKKWDKKLKKNTFLLG